MHEMDWIWLGVGCFFAAAMLALGHFAPTPKTGADIDERGRQIAHARWILVRYIYGTAVLFAGFCIARLPVGDWLAPLAMGAVIASGGVATIAAYGWDRVITALTREGMADHE